MSAREIHKKERSAVSWSVRTSSALFAGAAFALVSLSGHAATTFSDDFEDGNSTGWTATSPSEWVVITDGAKVLQRNVATASYNDAVGGAMAGADQDIEVKLKVNSFNSSSSSYMANVYGRHSGTQSGTGANAYFASVRGGGSIAINRRYNGSVSSLGTVGNSMVTGTWYTIRFKVTGSNPVTLEMYVNGVLKKSYSDTSTSQVTAAGKIAVGTYGANAEFDYVTVGAAGATGLGGATGTGGATSGLGGAVGGLGGATGQGGATGTGGSTGQTGGTPLAPQTLMVPPASTTSTGTTLIWSKPSTYSNVASYNVYKAGALLGNTTKLFYTVTGLSPATTASFTVRAMSSSGAVSADSNALSVTTPAAPTVINITASPYLASTSKTGAANATAIQAAINACPAGGVVQIPSGTFVSGAIMLKSNMTLQVDGTLKGSDLLADYPFTSMRFPYYPNGNYLGLVNAYTTSYGSLTNIRIAGTGTIDGGTYGSGSLTTLGSLQTSAKGDTARGDLITAKGVNGLFIGGGLTIVHPSEHTIFVSYSSNVTVNGITVNTYGIHNADGIDLATTDTAYIFNSTFDTGDDCVNFNAGTSAPGVTENKPINNVRVFNVLTKRGHGGVVFGSFTAGWIKNVLVEDCTFDGTDIGLRFKTGADRGGGSTLVTARDLTMKSIATDAILFDSNYPAGSGYAAASLPGVFQTITLYNITVATAKGYGIWIHGLSNMQHNHINMTNIAITSTKGASIDQFNTGPFSGVTFTSNTQSKVWTVTNTTGLTCSGCSPSYP
jgi:exo-poly-alpha-galacturonosidase